MTMELGMWTISPSSVRIITERASTETTVPMWPPEETSSPVVKGRRSWMITPPTKLARMSWRANATAIPAIPRAPRTGPMATPSCSSAYTSPTRIVV
jgi:hypothetical protein